MRVVAHFMGDERRSLAEDVLDPAYVTDVFVVGDTDRTGIARLRDAGMAVDVVETDAERDARAAGPWWQTLVRSPRQTARNWALARLGRDIGPPVLARFGRDIGPRRPDVDAPDVCVLTLAGPLLASWRDDLGDLDVRLIERVGPNAWTARLEPQQKRGVEDLSSVIDVRSYTVAETLAAMREDKVSSARAWELITHRAEDTEYVLGQLRVLVGDVSFVDRRTLRFPKDAHSQGVVTRIAAMPEVASLYEHRRATLSAERAGALVGALPALPGRDAVGELVAIADTGVDQTHPALAGRDVQATAWGRPADTGDPHGHGTHVAATVATVATGTGIYFQSLLDEWGGIGDVEDRLPDLLQAAYDAGARIHSDSWNVPGSGSTYRAPSMRLDEFVHHHPDMLVVVAAGNSAIAPKGTAELRSIDVPASAKNCLSVGASCGDRVGVVFPEQTWRMRDGQRFPKGPLADQPVTGDPEAIGAMSGRGPCEVARMKPDVVAPGTFLRAARPEPSVHNWWLIDPDDPQYAYDGGTSMATAVASGCAAIVRRYLINQRGHEPSAALVKATLINGARWLSGMDAVAGWDGAPNYHQGFGCLSLTTTLPGDHDPTLHIEFSDDWREGDPIVFTGALGEHFTFTVDVGDERPLRVCLAWTEHEARGAQTQLKLQMEHREGGIPWFGNAERPEIPGNLSDSDQANNVHIIRIASPPGGTYRLQVSAPIVSFPPQRFALIVSGALRSQLVRDE